MIDIILIIAAIICFVIAAFNLVTSRVQFGWLGAALFAASFLPF